MKCSAVTEPAVEVDVALRALAARERRAILACFIETGGGAVHLNDLAEYVATAVDETVDRIALLLCHRDLPCLEEAGSSSVAVRTRVIRPLASGREVLNIPRPDGY